MTPRTFNTLPTQKTVAEACDLSRGTVGAILSGDARAKLFSEKTRRKVLEAAARLNYRPHRAAQMMRRGRSNLIAVIYYGAGYNVGRRTANSLPKVLAAYGYNFLVFDFQWHGQYMDNIFREIIEHRVEGVLLLGVPYDTFHLEHLRMLQANRISVVALDCDDELPEVSHCYTNSQPAIAELTRHLLAQGHRTLFLLTLNTNSNVGQSRSERERIAGFREVLLPSGDCEIFPENKFFRHWQTVGETTSEALRGYVIRLVMTTESRNFMQVVYDFSKRLFATRRLPDAIMSCNDEGAIGIFNATRELGLKIPEDVAVTGYDDDHLGSYPAYALTTARHEVEKICEAAVHLLVEQIQTKNFSPSNKIFQPTLVLRKSCGRKARGDVEVEG